MSSTPEIFPYLSAEADDVLPQFFGLALVISSSCFYMHALPSLQWLDHLTEGEVLLGGVACRTVLGFGVIEQRTCWAAPLSYFLLQVQRGGRGSASSVGWGWSGEGSAVFPCFMSRGRCTGAWMEATVCAAAWQWHLLFLKTVQLRRTAGRTLGRARRVAQRALRACPCAEVGAGGAGRGKADCLASHQVDKVGSCSWRAASFALWQANRVG